VSFVVDRSATCVNIKHELRKEVKQMFRIPSFYVDAPEFKDAVSIMTRRGSGDLLAGMESMNELWDEYCKGELGDTYEDDEDFFYHWSYETNAYNVVFEKMSKLFVLGSATITQQQS